MISANSDCRGSVLGPILVTGGAGFIGWNLVKALRERGEDVVAVDDLSASPWPERPDGIAVRDVGSLAAAELRDIRAVVHLACRKVVPTSFVDREQMVGNIRIDRHLVGLLTEIKPRIAILASSCEVYGDQQRRLGELAPLRPRSPYAVGKVAMELLADVYRPLTATPICVARLFNTYGPGEGVDAVVPRFVDEALRLGQVLIEGSGEQRRDFTYVDDVVSALIGLLAAPHPPQVVNIGSGVSLSINELAARVAKAVGGVRIAHGRARPNEITDFVADTRLLRSVLPHWRPETGIDAGLHRCIAWQRALNASLPPASADRAA